MTFIKKFLSLLPLPEGLKKEYTHHYQSFDSLNQTIYAKTYGESFQAKTTDELLANSNTYIKEEFLSPQALYQKKVDFTRHADSSKEVLSELMQLESELVERSEPKTLLVKTTLEYLPKSDLESSVKKSLLSLSSPNEEGNGALTELCNFKDHGFDHSIYYPSVRKVMDKLNYEFNFPKFKQEYTEIYSGVKGNLKELIDPSLFSSENLALIPHKLRKLDCNLMDSLNLLSFDELLLLESFCTHFSDASTILLKPSIVASLGLKSFLLLHHKLYDEENLSSGKVVFNRILLDKIAKLKWTRYFSENKRLYKLPLSFTNSFYFSNLKFFENLRYFTFSNKYLSFLNNQIFPSKKITVLNVIGTCTTPKITLFTYRLLYPLKAVTPSNPHTVENYLNALLANSGGGTGYADPIRTFIGKIVYDIVSITGTITNSALSAFIARNSFLTSILAKSLDQYLFDLRNKNNSLEDNKDKTP